MTPSREGLLLSWLEPDGTGAHRLRFARSRHGETGAVEWSAPRTAASGTDFFANWADVPAVLEAPDGSLLAHWLARVGEGTYAYGIRLARSTDGGATWRPLGFLHGDGVAAEHGFVSWLPEDEGLRAFWLDGREVPVGGAMTLRSTRVSLTAGGVETGPEEVLDPRVCDCCPTDATTTGAGALVVYRDRSPDEVRDIHRLLLPVAAERSEGVAELDPAPVHADGWRVAGCPVNGPAVAASGERVAVAWFTASGGRAQVRAAFSMDGGRTFSAPIEVDRGAPLGRVDVVWIPSGEVVASWLERLGEDERGEQGDSGAGTAALMLRRLSPEGGRGEVFELGRTGAGRASGMPELARRGETLHAVWVETSEPPRLIFASVPWAALPKP